MPSGGSRQMCPPGEIKRVAYTRKSSKKSAVNDVYVKEACIKDRGEPGKGRKILPALGKEISLRKYGYDTDKNMQERHTALDKASKKYSRLSVLRRLNLAANIQPNDNQGQKITDVMRKDVDYLSKQYSKEK